MKQPVSLVAEAPGHAARDRAAEGVARLQHAGRFLALWLPAWAMLADGQRSWFESSTYSLAAATIWWLTIHAAFATTRTKRVAVGPVGAVAIGTVAGLCVVSALLQWLPGTVVGRVPLVLTAGAVFVAAASWELFLEAVVNVPRRVLVVGSAACAALADALAGAPPDGLTALGVADTDLPSSGAAVPIVGSVNELPDVVRRERPDLVVLGVSQRRPEVFASLLEVSDCDFRVVGLPELYEQAFGSVPVRQLTPLWFMSVFHLYQRPQSRIAKRLFDVVVAAASIVLTAPLFPLIALLIRRTPGPVIYRQIRLGEKAKPFTMYKLRTMRHDAEIGGEPIWASESDPRVTAIGRVLRRTRLDEFPQFWNVLKGDMSIVGPRPERPEYLAVLEAQVPFWSRRHLMKPGITGWAQITRGYTSDAISAEAKLSFDLWYLRHQSIAVDVCVCVKTLARLLSGTGAR
jgi:exopolysaccharide biosynthesis polyprenyl glycosylphosphotransferase